MMNKKLLYAAMWLGVCLLSGCSAETKPDTPESAAENTAEQVKTADSMETSGETDSGMKLSEEQTALFQQELLFLQQGFRQHNIQKSYTVYFAEPEEQEERFSQEILLEGEEGIWQESFTYTYNPAQDWYTFIGQYEPVLTQDDFYLSKDDESAEEFRDASVYRTELSAGMNLAAPLRFDIPSGPVVYDRERAEDNWEEDLRTYVYVYQDERLGVAVEIEYPQYSTYTEGIEDVEALNRCIRGFFFYGYGFDEKQWEPGREMYCSIHRNCEITRQDDRYLSACIYEDNMFRGANHPNSWKSGMVIDLMTGQALTLKDVIGPARTVEELTGTGAFHCLQIWKDGPLSPEETEETDRRQVEEAGKWVDADAENDFYLTPDKLGLTSSVGRYYVCMEAPLREIGLTQWEAAD